MSKIQPSRRAHSSDWVTEPPSLTSILKLEILLFFLSLLLLLYSLNSALANLMERCFSHSILTFSLQ